MDNRRPPSRLPPLADSPSKNLQGEPHVFRQTLSPVNGFSTERRQEDSTAHRSEESKLENNEECKNEGLSREDGSNMLAEISDFILSQIVSSELIPEVLEQLDRVGSPTRLS